MLLSLRRYKENFLPLIRILRSPMRLTASQIVCPERLCFLVEYLITEVRGILIKHRSAGTTALKFRSVYS
ncbi:unnamed protein product [Rhizophagus irregularis]|nr:unnamed protein product [Rhizophagus irregularis]